MWMMILAAFASPMDTTVQTISDAGEWHDVAISIDGHKSDLRKEIEKLEGLKLEELVPLLSHEGAAVRFATVVELERRKKLDGYITDVLKQDHAPVQTQVGCMGSPSSVAHFVEKRQVW